MFIINKNNFILFIFLGALMACNNVNSSAPDFSSQPEYKKDVSDTSPVKTGTDEMISSKDVSQHNNQKHKRNVEVLSIEKKFDSLSTLSKDYNVKCSEWKLSKADIVKILQLSTVIDGSEFHDYYDVLPCNYTGSVNIDGKLALYKVNAGSFSVLIFKDTSFYLGYNLKDDKRYFLSSPGKE